MLNTNAVSSGVKEILESELSVTEGQIKESMIQNNQVVTRKTINSLRREANATSGFIAGADHIDTLEIGISPERSRQSSFTQVKVGLMNWVQAKHGFGGSRKDLNTFGYMAAAKQQSIGSVLFRMGGNRNVYSDKVTPLLTRISERVGDLFVNIKILD